MSKSSLGVKKETNPDFWSFLEKVVGSFKFRLFLFIFLIYIAGATLDVTNTNPGSRFMLTKSMARYGEFSIREEDRERYSYLDFSVLNRFSNPSFENGIGVDALEWIEYKAYRSNKSSISQNGDYSAKLNTTGGWVEQDIVDSAVHSIYDGNFSFKASKSGDSESYLNITIFYRDSTISTHRTDISSSYLKEYRINLANIHPDKIIDRIRFQNSNTTTIFLDEIHLGYIYSDKAPGLSLLAVPIYWLGDIISVYLFGIDPSNHFMIDDIV
ncbi:MAG: hypothetical protein ACXACU_15920, partial [Candidatus Hodarchaeales archaeon]